MEPTTPQNDQPEQTDSSVPEVASEVPTSPEEESVTANEAPSEVPTLTPSEPTAVDDTPVSTDSVPAEPTPTPTEAVVPASEVTPTPPPADVSVDPTPEPTPAPADPVDTAAPTAVEATPKPSAPETTTPQVFGPTAAAVTPDVATPVVAGPQVFGDVTAPGTPAPEQKATKKSKKKLAIIGAVAAIVVLGGGAGAYAAVQLNKPINVLKLAVAHSLQQTQTTSTGTLQITPKQTGGVAAKLGFTSAVNTTQKASDLQLNLTVSGVTIPVEARVVSGDVYFKIDDLTNIQSLVAGFAPQYASLAQTLSSQISGKWFSVDSTLLDEAGVSCELNTSYMVSKADINLLNSQYDKAPFTTIQSTSSDTVNGQKVTKMVLSVDDDKLAAYIKNLQDLSVIKQLQKCSNAASLDTSVSSLADHDTTPLTIWINKGKRQIVQLSTTSTSKDSESGVLTVDFDYSKPVNVTAPANAIPVTQLLTSLEQVLGSAGIDPSTLLSGASN